MPKVADKQPRAEFAYTLYDEILVLFDLNGARSLTNDMEHALATVRREERIDLSGRTIIYQDSTGRFDRVEYHMNRVSFHPIGLHELDEALAFVRKQKS